MYKTIYLSNLFDYYGELLTDKQQDYFKSYYFNNLTLSEIAENENVSRNAVHKQIKDTENKLIHYENILKQYQNSQKIKEIIKNINPEIKKQIEDLL